MTLPAHASMLTGTIPPYHGIRDNAGYKLDQSNITLAEVLDRNGYTTGAIISAFVMDSQFGLDQGFDYYNDSFEKPLKEIYGNERRGEEASRLAAEWLGRHENKRFFLFLHYFDPHTRYDPPEPFASRFQGNHYAGEIAYTDFCIGQVIDKLKEMGMYESTLIIVTGDHGEMLGEHGEKAHAYFVYQSALKVPLIFKLPGTHKGKKIDDPAGIVDIVPTVCGILGIETPPHVRGKDLSCCFEGDQPSVQDRYLYCESLFSTKYGANSLMGVVSDRWKYIQTTRPELYDLFEDPDEINNLVKQQVRQARVFQDRLRQMLEESAQDAKSDSKAALDDDGRKRLESLGYLARLSVNEDFEFDQDKDDPKDLIGFHNLNGKVQKFISQKKFSEAKVVGEKMLRERPHDLGVYYCLATIADLQADFAGVVSYMTDAIRIKPDEARAYNMIGTSLIRLNKTDEAISHFSEALRIDPEYSKSHYNLGSALAGQGRISEAIKHFSEALRINPNCAEAHGNLGLVMASQGMISEAIKHYSEALRINPGLSETHYNLGMVLAKQGRIPEAIKYFSEALQINPRFAQAHNSMGVVLANQSRTEEAIKHFSEALRINPAYEDARNNLKKVLALRGK